MPLTRWLLMACSGWVFAQAQALTLGPPPAGIALGRPLNVSWPVRLDAGEVLEPECISAELMLGDKPVPAHKLRWTLEPGPAVNERMVHVVSLVVIDEPVVTLQVSAGCSARVSRRFTAFAEPPLSGAAPNAQAQTAAEPATAAAESTSAPQMRVPPKPRRSTALSLKDKAPGASAADAATAAPATPSSARLSLDRPDIESLQRALTTALAEHRIATAQEAAQEAAQSAEAASASAASAIAAAERMQALEERVTRLLDENQQQREQMQQLRQRVSRGEAAGRAMPWLLVGLLACLAAAAWLAMKLRRQQREAQAKWWADAADVMADARPDPTPSQASRLEPSPPLPGVADDMAAAIPKPQAWPPPAPAAAPDDEPAAAAPAKPGAPSSLSAPDTAMNPVSVQPDLPTTNPLPRTLSIEELIDLEQQADFFIALGQDDAAIDLLMSYLRDSGGTSPLPYLKLLEIYRRRNDREAHDRIRSRFNLRFNGYAPAWDTDMLQGRALVDYPDVMLRLQRAWPSPIDAMAELETMMFRKDGGELFELPAYREVLLLYSLARSLLDYQARLQPDVDVLLPLSISDSERIDLNLDLAAAGSPPSSRPQRAP